MVRYVRGTRRQPTGGTCGLYMFSHRFPWDIANAENGWYECNIDVDIVYVLFVIFFGGPPSLPLFSFLPFSLVYEDSTRYFTIFSRFQNNSSCSNIQMQL